MPCFVGGGCGLSLLFEVVCCCLRVIVVVVCFVMCEVLLLCVVVVGCLFVIGCSPSSLLFNVVVDGRLLWLMLSLFARRLMSGICYILLLLFDCVLLLALAHVV